MNSIVLFKQLLVLLGMVTCGYLAYKGDIIDEHCYQKLSRLVIKILNPFMMLSGVIGKDINFGSEIILQNILMVTGFYFIMFLAGFLYVRIMRTSERESYLYRMLILLPNAGFMGIPIVKEMLGSEYIVLVAFYVLGFNLLAYTYGIHLASKFGGKTKKLSLKSFFSPGTLTALAAIIIFFLHIQLPQPVNSFINYMGETCIVMSMIVIGAFLANMNLKEAFLNINCLAFIVGFMLISPFVLIKFSRLLPVDPSVLLVFQIITTMPVGTANCMFAQEYGGDGSLAAKIIAATTLVTVVTAPLVFL